MSLLLQAGIKSDFLLLCVFLLNPWGFWASSLWRARREGSKRWLAGEHLGPELPLLSIQANWQIFITVLVAAQFALVAPKEVFHADI